MTNNLKKIIKAYLTVIFIALASYCWQGYKLKCMSNNNELIVLETQLFEAKSIIEDLKSQLANNELALKQAHNQIMSFKSKCKDCQFLTQNQNWGE